MTKGLCIGKFYPPHKGHHFLIDFALERVDELDVLVCDHPDYKIPAELRAKWLKRRHPKAHVRIIEDIGKDDDSRAWATHTIVFLGYAPDVVFSSEDYGDTYAACMGAKHIKVDKQRVQVPIAATRIRNDVLKHWDYMEPHVRADHALRVCVLGAESTGTTTLSNALAEHYKTLAVPEYGRLYSEVMMRGKHELRSDEFVFIARQQQRLEHQLAGQCNNGLLICDTNAFATRLWHERYFDHMNPAVDAIADHAKVDLFIITDDDIPFVQDGFRDGEHIRHEMQKRFVEEVKASNILYVIASGPVKQRLQTVIPLIDDLIAKGVTI